MISYSFELEGLTSEELDTHDDTDTRSVEGERGGCFGGL